MNRHNAHAAFWRVWTAPASARIARRVRRGADCAAGVAPTTLVPPPPLLLCTPHLLPPAHMMNDDAASLRCLRSSHPNIPLCRLDTVHPATPSNSHTRSDPLFPTLPQSPRSCFASLLEHDPPSFPACRSTPCAGRQTATPPPHTHPHPLFHPALVLPSVATHRAWPLACLLQRLVPLCTCP